MTGPSDIPQPPESARPAPVHKWRRRLKRLGLASVIMVVTLAAGAVTSEHYTSQPQFCGSCHIMEPYYETWKKDAHSAEGTKCVDCHYAPGQQHTLMAKFRGLSQVTSYFSGRAGAGRPKARVNDASCTTSGCHGDGKFMNTELRLGNVTFVHAKHLEPDGKIAVEQGKKIADLREKLTAALGRNRLTAIELLAKPIQTADDRNAQLTTWLDEQKLSSMRDDILNYAELLHTEVRLEHLKGFKCSSCHEFDAKQHSHFSVNKTTCYTCHFINQPFNANSGRCLACHEPPTAEVPIHAGETSELRMPTAKGLTAAGKVTMNHATIVANNVSCISCHAELIHGSGQVTRRDCQNCHDQDHYLRDFDRLNTSVVTEYHRIHAAGQRARCNDCHQIIEHKLLPVASPGDEVALLSPVRRDCQHCHPDHHREQIELLLGRGGFVEGATGMTNPMTGSRANCRACHTKVGEDPKQEAVIVGTLESCRGCHGQEYEQLFVRWQHSIEGRLQDANTLLARVQQRLAGGSQPNDLDRPEAVRLLDRAKRNIRLVMTANGMHNKNYALMLLDQAVLDLEEALKRLDRRAGQRG